MQIRTKLTLQFLILGGLIMIISSVAIYYSSSRFRQDDFYNRLRNKSRNTARLLLETDELNADRLKKIESNNPDNMFKERIIILNFLDEIIYSTDSENDIKINYDVLERIRSGRIVYFKQGQYEVLGTLYYVHRDRYVLIAGAIDKEGIQHLNALKTILIAVFFISLVLSTIAGWIYAGKALKPITNVIDQVENITITSLNLRVSEGNGEDEIGRLAKTFNKMLVRLENAFALQKNFISNASHELRTPLTAINGQLDVLMMKNRSTDEYKIAITSVLDDIKSLIDISNRLLLIARTSAEGPIRFNNKIRIDEVLWQSREEIIKFHTGYHVNIIIADSFVDAEQMVVIGDEYLLKVAVSNIIENGCKYSSDQKVDIEIMPFEKYIRILFEDHGIGIPEEDMIKIYEPFYRAKNALGIAGSGIGLSIVNQIVAIHNGKISIHSEVNKGTKIEILLPMTYVNQYL